MHGTCTLHCSWSSIAPTTIICKLSKGDLLMLALDISAVDFIIDACSFLSYAPAIS